MTNNKWLLTQTMSLGFCRDTFKAGSVIVELDDSLMINGKEYKDNRDLEILKRQMIKNPESPWMIPYTEEDERRLLSTGKTETFLRKRPPTDHAMPVISSDDDLIEAIDVSNTQVSVVNEHKRQMEREAAKNGKLEVIPDQEDVETHLKRIAGLGDAASIAERVEIKSSGLPKMAVVRDDTLGAQYGSRQNPALNAGQVIPAKHIGSSEQKPSIEASEERKFSIESIVEALLKKYFGDLGGIVEKLKLLEGLGAKLKLLEEIAGKIKALDQIGVLLQKYEELKALLNELQQKVDVASQFVNSDNVSSSESSVVESEVSMDDELVSDDDSQVDSDDGMVDVSDDESSKSTSAPVVKKQKKGKAGRKAKH